MTRYEGMDEILGALRERLGQEAAVESPTALSDPLAILATEREDVAAQLERLRCQAVMLRQRLDREAVRKMNPAELDEALSLLGKVLHELWQCESALQGVAPIE